MTIYLTLNDALPNWGEGETKDEALNDLLHNVVERHLNLMENYDKLGVLLREEADFMNNLVTRLTDDHEE